MKSKQPISIDASLAHELLHPRPAHGHKGTFGHVFLIAGSHGMMGAALLAGEAALRSGAGKLTAHIPESEAVVFQTRLPEAILKFDESSRSSFSSPSHPDGYDSFIIGPGIGTAGETAWALRTQLKLLLEAEHGSHPIPLVLDADALNLMAGDYQMLSLLPKATILTPHMGEMRKLCTSLGMSAAKEEEMQAAAAQIAAELHLNIVLKSHHTHIFTADGEIFKNERQGNSGMGTAGSGDVLSGIIGGLLAQGYSARDAAVLGVFLHATAGDNAARKLGRHCMLASDILAHLPYAFLSISD